MNEKASVSYLSHSIAFQKKKKKNYLGEENQMSPEPPK